jgi:hypothetical protein
MPVLQYKMILHDAKKSFDEPVPNVCFPVLLTLGILLILSYIFFLEITIYKTSDIKTLISLIPEIP